ncbi:dienelactone hydrolase family protein [Desulfovibrio litoralis]|uniref:Alpha/beta hydrolase family protein n=1 Tax=Desulfovibrio litoralis DSM 11393 TaxID=1121455 RepID=A0A1M7SBU9_9BACT|nr:dienelactone hydrolase family protein [Desulfovibrio litoralis]SHN55712.1 Alpha/beta hydrolase family protein [Desulfovibrio litoralis DSM 11393]
MIKKNYILLVLSLFLNLICFSELQAWPSKNNKEYAALYSTGGWIPDSSEGFELAVWLPSQKPSSFFELDGWNLLRFSSTVAEATHKYPLIIIAHDSIGNRFSLNDVATKLAASGFVVVAPTFIGDNLDDMSKALTLESLLIKPKQLVYTIETVLHSEEFGSHIDSSRIGLIGIGNGITPVLQLVGASLSEEGWSNYCPSGESSDFYCQPIVKSEVTQLITDLVAFKKTPEAFMLNPPLQSALFPKPEVKVEEVLPPLPPDHDKNIKDNTAKKNKKAKDKNKKNTASDNIDTIGTTELSEAEQQAVLAEQKQIDKMLNNKTQDKIIIKSVLLLTPGHSFLFSDESFKNVTLPIALVLAEDDELYPLENHGLPLTGKIGGMPEQVVFEKTDHYSLLAPLPKKLTALLPELSGRATLKQRAKIAEKRDSEILSFFKKTLGDGVELPVNIGNASAKTAEKTETNASAQLSSK